MTSRRAPGVTPRRWLVWLAAIAVCAGCAAPGQAPASPAPSQPVGTPAPREEPSQSSTVLASMPAADGKPMLWPAKLELPHNPNSGQEDIRYGFVNELGKLVVPQRYEIYTYCGDEHGRAEFLILSRPGAPTELVDLTGRLIRRVPADTIDCGGAGHVVVTKIIDGEIGKYNSGLMSVATGVITVPQAKDRHIELLDPRTVNVSDRSGEFFLDVVTGKRTPHPGWLDTAGLSGDMKLIPAQDKPRGEDGTVGFLSRDGRWALKPTYVNAGRFHSGFASVQIGEKSSFVDTSFQQVGGEWDGIMSVTAPDEETPLGYVATLGDDEQTALLGTDLRVIVPPAPGQIVCDSADSGLCTVVPPSGPSRVVALPSGAVQAMPAGFSSALSSAFYLDNPDPEEGATNRLYVVATGAEVALAGPSGCEPVGTDWAVCQIDEGMSVTEVFDANGHRRAFASVEAIPDPLANKGPAYYWVTSGAYQGFVDSQGAWRFRQSRFTQLDD